MSILDFAKLAKDVVKVPNSFALEGKRVGYDMFYSEHIALPVAGWLAQSMGHNLFGEEIMPLALIADESSLSGLKLSGRGNHWSSKQLLVLSGAIEELSYPALKIRGYDYSTLLLSMRDKVLTMHKKGSMVPCDSLALSNHIYSEIAPRGLKFKPDMSFAPRGK